MNEINFLPQSYLTQRARRRRIFRETTLIAFVVAGVVGWYLPERERLSQLESNLQAIEQELAGAGKNRMEADKLHKREKLLRSQVRIERELTQPLTCTSIVAAFSELMPEPIAMTEMSMVRPRPPLNRATNESGGRKKKQTTGKKEDDGWKTLTVRLHGLAPTGVEIANLFGALEEHPLFEQVRMEENRSKQLDAVVARQFQIGLTVPFDRDYRPTSEAPSEDEMGEVANAD